MTEQHSAVSFADLGLPEPLLKALSEVGYETPSPIQAQSIPYLLDGEDILGQAQTGTGKTAAFALPLLANVNMQIKAPQILVLTPTRELCIQVAEACQTYARFMPGFHVLPIYGGQSYGIQLKHLNRGVQMVVGTPGRIMDHMRRGSLKLDQLQAIVLDEADEMLRMGFIDDVEWILEHTPETRQTALFSATMPKEIQRVANNYLDAPKTIKIKSKTQTAASISQRFWPVGGVHKMDALTRILEVEDFDAVIIFVRTKTATVEIAEKLQARGFAAEALNGDIPQNNRERIVDRLRDGKLEILVATDVVARGLDVPRISHVINYDIPYDTESYVHRIGRTGRAGREGAAILFVANRERRLLKAIERATKQPIEQMRLPTVKDVNEMRLQQFKERIDQVLNNNENDLAIFHQLIQQYQQETEADPMHIAAALAHLAQGETPLLLSEKQELRPERERGDRGDRGDRHDRGRDRDNRREPRARKMTPKDISPDARPLKEFPEIPMERFKLEVGYQDGVKPGNIVGAIANEADIESRYIGHIEIFDDFSLVDLPADMPKDVFGKLKKTWICNKKANFNRMGKATEQVVEDTPVKKKKIKKKRKAN